MTGIASNANTAAARAARIHREFVGRDARQATPGDAAAYWDKYRKAIASLPGEFRIHGTLMTLILNAGRISGLGNDMLQTALHDLRTFSGSEASTLDDWINNLADAAQTDDLTLQIEHQLDLIEVAQQIKMLVRLRLSAAKIRDASQAATTKVGKNEPAETDATDLSTGPGADDAEALG